MANNHYRILLFVCVLALYVSGHAQMLSNGNTVYKREVTSTPDLSSENRMGKADNIIQQIDERMAELDSLIFRCKIENGTPELLQWSVDCAPDSNYAAAVDASALARIKALKAENGLQLTGQTYYRPDANLGLDDDDEDAVSRYNGKIQVELRWYFLQSSLLKKKSRVNEINVSADIERLEHERGRTAPDLYANRERLRTESDSVLASILLHRVDNLALLEEAYMYLLENENISSDNLLRVLDDRAEAERRLTTISCSPTLATALSAVTVGLITIDTTKVMATLTATDIDIQILDLKEQLIDNKTRSTTWWSDVRLAPFVRFSQYFRPTMSSSRNVDAGLSFTIPLSNPAPHIRKELQAERSQIACLRTDKSTSLTDKVQFIALETERLNRAIAGECERAASLRRYLQIRRAAFTRRSGEYNRLSALMDYNSYLRCLENIVDMQYRRNTQLAELQALLPSIPLADYCMYSILEF